MSVRDSRAGLLAADQQLPRRRHRPKGALRHRPASNESKRQPGLLEREQRPGRHFAGAIGGPASTMGAPLWRELHFLAALGNQAAFLELLNGIQDQALLDSLLRAAAEAGHSHIVALLIERDADAYSADARGMTPIGLACGRGRMGTVQLLLGEGAHFYNLSSADDRCVAWFLAAVIDSHQQLSADAAQLTAAVEAVRQERDQLKQDKNHLQQDNDSLQGVVAAQQAEIDQLRAELGQQQ